MLLPILKPELEEAELRLKNPGCEVKSYLIPCVLVNCEKFGNFNLLVEQITGKIIVNRKNNQTIKLVDLKQLTPNEISLLEYAKKRPNFKPEDVPLGIGLEKTRNAIKQLVKLNLLDWNPSGYRITDEYKLYTNPQRYTTNEKFENLGEEYIGAKKLEPTIGIDKIREIISNFENIIKVEEGFILHHYVSK